MKDVFMIPVINVVLDNFAKKKLLFLMYAVCQKFTARYGFGISIKHRSRMLAMKKLSEVTANNQSYYDFTVG